MSRRSISVCFNHGRRIGNNVAAQLEVQRWGLIGVDARRSAVQYSSKLLHMEDSGLHPFTSGDHLRLFSLYTYVTIIQKRQVSTRLGLFPYRFEYYFKYIPFLKWVQVPVRSQRKLFISVFGGNPNCIFHSRYLNFKFPFSFVGDTQKVFLFFSSKRLTDLP